jgi:acetolactate synthase regulatory subunit
MAKLVFHVRHNAKPTLIKEVLQILGEGASLTLDDVLNVGRQRGYQVGTAMQSRQSLKENPVQTARDLGLIADGDLSLTNLGQQMLRLLRYKPSVLNEIMHVLHYTIWTPDRSTEHCFSWSYRTTCEQLWESGSTAIDRGYLVSQVSEMAMTQFDTNRVSFSKDSVRGVLQWLAELEPPVLDEANRTFIRRTFCPPETFAFAVDYLYQVEDADYQTNLLLDIDKQETICKVCLLEPTAFDTAFDWAVGQYDFLRRSTSGGWGNYILLTRQPQIQDFLG